MSQRHPRAQLAAITAGLAAAALLGGPAATWALDVAGVTGSAGSATTQVTGAAQEAVDTTQQTVATTVTNVESTAQTTVQTTTQAAQPVVNEVQASAPAAAAPKPAAQPTIRPSAATKSVARRTATAVHAVRTPVLTSSARSLRQSVAAPTRPTPTRHSVRLSAARHSSSAAAPTSPAAASPAAPQCGGLVQVLNPLLAVAPPVGALLTAVCDAGNGLLGLPQTGTGREAVLPFASPAAALAALAAGALRANARGAGLVGRRGPDPYPVRDSGAGDPLAGAASQTGLATAGGNGVALGHSGSFVSAATAVAGSRVGREDPPAANGAGHSHNGLFGTSISGTEVVFAILVLDWAILVALVMWRVARRRPVLRYAIAWRARRARVAPRSPGRLAALFSIVR